MSVKLLMLNALVDATARMTAAIAALAADDFDTVETELSAVHRILTEQSQELRAA